MHRSRSQNNMQGRAFISYGRASRAQTYEVVTPMFASQGNWGRCSCSRSCQQQDKHDSHYQVINCCCRRMLKPKPNYIATQIVQTCCKRLRRPIVIRLGAISSVQTSETRHYYQHSANTNVTHSGQVCDPALSSTVSDRLTRSRQLSVAEWQANQN